MSDDEYRECVERLWLMGWDRLSPSVARAIQDSFRQRYARTTLVWEPDQAGALW